MRRLMVLSLMIAALLVILPGKHSAAGRRIFDEDRIFRTLLVPHFTVSIFLTPSLSRP
jgi:hypothetical protein